MDEEELLRMKFYQMEPIKAFLRVNQNILQYLFLSNPNLEESI
jgi:hypothetical protein